MTAEGGWLGSHTITTINTTNSAVVVPIHTFLDIEGLSEAKVEKIMTLHVSGRQAQAEAAAAAKNIGKGCDENMLDPGKKARVEGQFYIVQLKRNSWEVMHEGGQVGNWVVKQVGHGTGTKAGKFVKTAAQKADDVERTQEDRRKGLIRDRTQPKTAAQKAADVKRTQEDRRKGLIRDRVTPEARQAQSVAQSATLAAKNLATLKSGEPLAPAVKRGIMMTQVNNKTLHLTDAQQALYAQQCQVI